MLTYLSNLAKRSVNEPLFLFPSPLELHHVANRTDFFLIYLLFFLLYNIVLVLPYINKHPPRVYTYFHLEPPSHLPPHTIPLGHPNAPAASLLYPASNLDWRFIFCMILYMF